MTKPLHPAAESLKVGQVFYILSPLFLSKCWLYEVHQIRVMSESYPKPLQGEVVEAAPASFIREWMSCYSRGYFKADCFYSKRKAKTKAKALNLAGRAKL